MNIWKCIGQWFKSEVLSKRKLSNTHWFDKQLLSINIVKALYLILVGKKGQQIFILRSHSGMKTES